MTIEVNETLNSSTLETIKAQTIHFEPIVYVYVSFVVLSHRFVGS